MLSVTIILSKKNSEAKTTRKEKILFEKKYKEVQPQNDQTAK